MTNLTDREWKPFYIGDIFDKIESGKAKGHNHLTHDDKGVPYIGATNRNNGVLDLVKPTSALQRGNAIGFIKNGNGVGSAGHAIYKAESFMSTSDVIYGYAKWLNRHVGLFFTTCSDMNESKFSHGYKWTPERIRRSLVTLPVCNDKPTIPDYAFMEAYVKEREDALLERYRAFVGKRTIPHRGGVKPRCEPLWRAYRLLDYFDYKRGDQKDMNSLSLGEEMLVSARNTDNGLKGFCKGESCHYRFPGDCLTLNNDGDGGVGLSYYQPHEFLLDTHVYALYPKAPVSKFALLFMSRAISMCRPCFSHGHSISKSRLRTLRVMLPSTPDGSPDFGYMETRSVEIMRDRIDRYFAFRKAHSSRRATNECVSSTRTRLIQ